MGQEERWIKFHERFAEQTANLVGALPTEVVSNECVDCKYSFTF